MAKSFSSGNRFIPSHENTGKRRFRSETNASAAKLIAAIASRFAPQKTISSVLDVIVFF